MLASQSWRVNRRGADVAPTMRAPTVMRAPAPSPAWSLFDSSKLGGQSPDKDGRVLGPGQTLLSIFNAISGVTAPGVGAVYSAGGTVFNGASSESTAPGGWSLAPQTVNVNGVTLSRIGIENLVQGAPAFQVDQGPIQDYAPISYEGGSETLVGGQALPMDAQAVAAYQASVNAKYATYEQGLAKQFGLDPSATYAQWRGDNPTGNRGKDIATVTYKVDAAGNATPIDAQNDYVPSSWVGSGRDFVKLVAAAVATAGVAAYLAPAAGAATSTAATTAASTDAAVGASNLTIAGATAAGIPSGLGVEGFGAGLGSAITATGTGGGILDAITMGSAAFGVAAPITFAGQGISLASVATPASASAPLTASGSPALESAPAVAAPAASSLAPAAASGLPSLAQVVGGAGTLAGIVGKGAALVNQLAGSHATQAPQGGTGTQHATFSPLLAIAGIGLLAFVSLKG